MYEINGVGAKIIKSQGIIKNQTHEVQTKNPLEGVIKTRSETRKDINARASVQCDLPLSHLPPNSILLPPSLHNLGHDAAYYAPGSPFFKAV